jgi:glucuronosyltransferase
MRSAAVDLAWYQYLLLDVIAVLFLIVFAILMIFYMIVKKLFSLCRRVGRVQNTKPKAKKN